MYAKATLLGADGVGLPLRARSGRPHGRRASGQRVGRETRLTLAPRRRRRRLRLAGSQAARPQSISGTDASCAHCSRPIQNDRDLAHHAPGTRAARHGGLDDRLPVGLGRAHRESTAAERAEPPHVRGLRRTRQVEDAIGFLADRRPGSADASDRRLRPTRLARSPTIATALSDAEFATIRANLNHTDTLIALQPNWHSDPALRPHPCARRLGLRRDLRLKRGTDKGTDGWLWHYNHRRRH